MHCFKYLFVLGLVSSPIMETSHGLNFPGDNKIVGGKPTTIKKHPYEVFLLLQQTDSNNTFRCAGSIANQHCIITAAHCLLDKESVNIRVGSTQALKGGTTYTSRMLITHPQYNPMTKDYDIGIIKVMKSIELDGKKSARVEFPQSNCSLPSGTNVTVAGWGHTDEDSDDSNTLIEVSIRVISNTQCKESYSNLTPRMICAGFPEGGKDSCTGDSGGALVKTGTKTQVGLVSYGKGCARAKYPGVYTNLCNPNIQQWLKNVGCM